MPRLSDPLRGRVAVVTGASRGMGAAARLLAQRSATVAGLPHHVNRQQVAVLPTRQRI